MPTPRSTGWNIRTRRFLPERPSVNWVYEFDPRALKELSRLGKEHQRRIFNYLDERITDSDDPRRFGKPLQHEFAGLWRYRVGDYRIICRIEDQKMVVLVIKVSHRRNAYG